MTEQTPAAIMRGSIPWRRSKRARALETARPRPKRAATLVAAVGAAGGLILTGPSTAFAAGTATPAVASHPTCSPAKFSSAQQRVDAALNARVLDLATLANDVQGAPRLTSSDRATLSTTLSGTTSGIQALVAKVPTDTTCSALWADAKSMVRTYRVFAVVAPQAHLAIASDSATSVESLVASDEPAIQQAITTAQSEGKNVAGAQAAFGDLQTEVTNAQSSTSGVTGSVLSQSPASYPASTPVFESARNSIRSAYGDLKAARKDLRTIVSSLR